MSALTPGQRSGLVRRTRSIVIAAAKKCERDMATAHWLGHYNASMGALIAQERAEIASIQAFAAIEYMQRQLQEKT